jgi:eukaryotic translation initiation factor 2C
VQAGASHTGVRVGKNKYFFGPSQGPLGGGVEGLRGYFASVRPVWKSMMVNVNVCMTAFIESKNMATAIEDFQRGSRGAMPQLSAMFGKSVLRVKTKHLGHRKKVWKIEDKNCNQLSFPCEELGGTVTVAQYFRKSKYISIHLPAGLMSAIRIPKYPSQES